MQSTEYTNAALPIRKLYTDLSQGFPCHWFGGDAFRTAYYNALSMSFPFGEQLFIGSVKSTLALLPDTAEHANLRNLCADLAAQVATHRHVHAQFNAVLEQQGLKNHVEPRIWARFKKYEHRMSPRHHVAVTAAYEHYNRRVCPRIAVAGPGHGPRHAADATAIVVVQPVRNRAQGRGV